MASVLGRACASIFRRMSTPRPSVRLLARQRRSSVVISKEEFSRWTCRPVSTSAVLFAKVVPFPLADIGEGIFEAQVMKWFVQEGDSVSEFDEICEVQSDKIVTTHKKISIDCKWLCQFAPFWFPEVGHPDPEELVSSQVAETMREEASVTITSRYSGIVKKLHYEVDDIARVGKPLVDIEVTDGAEGEDDPSTQPPLEEGQPAAVPRAETSASMPSKVLATPAVRRIAAENEVTLSDVIGTGKDGRVLKEDVMRHLEGGTAEVPYMPQATAPPVSAPPPLATPSQSTPAPDRVILTADKVESVKGLRRTMVKTMTLSGQVPQFGYCDEINLNELVHLRSTLKDLMMLKGVKMSYMPFFIKAVSLSLQHYPVLNSHVSADCSSITYKASHNIGVAMDTANGLLVPNVKDVQDKTVIDIAKELDRMMQLGHAGQLGMADLTGGTFSLSNIGAVGGTYARPMLLPPEVAIGAFGRVRKLPRYNDTGEVLPTHIMEVSWSADHRVIDGATVARFSNQWKSYLETPVKMLTELK